MIRVLSQRLSYTNQQFPALFLFGLLLVAKEILQFIHELLDILELSIDRGEADIGYPIQPVEFLHHSLPDFGTLHLSIPFFLKIKLDAVDNLLNHVDADRPLFAGLFQAIEDFDAIESLSSSILFDHQWKGILGPLACGKSLLTTETLPPPPNGLLILPEAGIDDFTLRVTAKRAFHELLAPFPGFEFHVQSFELL